MKEGNKTRAARRDDWKNEPMPKKHDSFVLTRSFSDEEMDALRLGNVPQEMEDKWFWYMEGSTLWAHRSWTGYCIYQIDFKEDNNHVVIVNRDPEQYTCTSIEEDIKSLNKLLDWWTQNPYDHYNEWLSETYDTLKKETKMRIAVTYDNGEVFQHFGHTETFKIYEVQDGAVMSSELFESNGSGHEALASLLAEKKIDVLICGGIGGGAQAALEACGIELCAGASGNADEAVEAYLKGELINTGANCDHHGEEHDCSEHDCSTCSGCHSAPPITGKNVGKTCRTHYRGTFNDGTQFDSSYDRGEPLEFVCGVGMMIRGYDAAVANMEVGETVEVHLMPEEAYGEINPDAIFTAEIENMPGAEEVEVGQQVFLQNMYGRPVPVKVIAKDEKTITFDANHEMAGKELNFTIELVEVID